VLARETLGVKRCRRTVSNRPLDDDFEIKESEPSGGDPSLMSGWWTSAYAGRRPRRNVASPQRAQQFVASALGGGVWCH
jgi:hypothetical protein